MRDRISAERLRNTSALAAACLWKMPDADVIVAAIEELLELRATLQRIATTEMTGAWYRNWAREALKGKSMEPIPPSIGCETHDVIGLPCPQCEVIRLRSALEQAAASDNPRAVIARALHGDAPAVETCRLGTRPTQQPEGFRMKEREP